MKKILMIIIGFLLCFSLASAASFNTKVELELTGLTGITELDNSGGTSVNVTIQTTGGTIVVTRNAAAGIYKVGEIIPIAGADFSLDYSTDYVYNLSTWYGDFLYPFTTPAEPAGGAELHTGQTTSYYSGDDASLDGTQKSYTDNGDGTVTDDQTGFMWQKADYSSSLSMTAAINYCNGLVLAGYSDWHLPTVPEAVTLMDYSCVQHTPSYCRWNLANNALTWNHFSGFWTSTTNTITTTEGYYSDFSDGTIGTYAKGGGWYVRCVRLG